MPPRERQEDALTEPLLPRQQQEQQPERVSRNVTLTLLYTGFAFAGRSIWSQSVLATFVYLLRNDNPEAVGYITAVMGLSQLVTCFPAGFLADRHRRDTLLKLGSMIGVLAIGATLLACRHENYIYLVTALAVWGCCWGIANTSLTALFADSIRNGERSKYFTRRSILITLGNTAGPTVGLTMFALLGDNWTIKDCAIVMAMGQAICFPAVLLLCFLNDDFVPNHHEEGVIAADEQENAEMGKVEESLAPVGQADSHESLSDETEDSREYVYGCLPKQRSIPILIATADLISGLGSGMSIRYFPIFFVDNLKLGPVLVQVLYILAPLMQAGLFQVAQILAKRFGRCHVAALFKWTGITFMFGMILAYKLHLPTWIVCAIYVVRTAFMNSTGALTRSVLMDNVPKGERGKWSALESVNMFSWSGSAAMGGWLIGLVGILPLFAVTASAQLTATLPLIALFGKDAELSECDESQQSLDTSQSSSDVPNNDNLRPSDGSISVR